MPELLQPHQTSVPVAHQHIWHFVHNARGGWLWHCACGAYRNNDGRIRTPNGA